MPVSEHLENASLRAFAARVCGATPEQMELDIQPLRGGLESLAVARVHARAARDRRSVTFVAKQLDSGASREARIYRYLMQTMARSAAPSLLGMERIGPDRCCLYLEWVRPAHDWPWRQTEYARDVVCQLARLHTLPSEPIADVLAAWDYDAELAGRAYGALEFLETSDREALAPARRSLPALRRVVAALPELRRQLLEFPPLGRALLHGDVHSGNVIIKQDGGAERPLFIDWARARVGSPLEDISSWLQSLGYWEWEVKRRHDTLLSSYLAERGLSTRLHRDMRDAYWLASASNVLAGALSYYLGATADAATARERDAAAGLLEDCLRIIRRADACWG